MLATLIDGSKKVTGEDCFCISAKREAGEMHGDVGKPGTIYLFFSDFVSLSKAGQKVLLSGVTPCIQKQFPAADESSRALDYSFKAFINISRLYSPSSAQGRLAVCVAFTRFPLPRASKKISTN